jgi:exopolysaccharide production protein ExoZ
MHKLNGIQWLRGFAAIMVVIFHAASRWGYGFEIGEAGVDVFFVMSGFIMWSVGASQTSPVDFLRDRIVRVAPAYWVATGLMALGGVAGLFPHVAISAARIAKSLFFVPYVGDGGHMWPMLVQGWTLNYEMMFYALFALLIALPVRFRLWSLVGSLALLAAAGLVGPRDAVLVFYTDPIVLEFALGALIGHYAMHHEFHRGIVGAMLLLGIAFFVIDGLGMVQAVRIVRLGMPAALTVAGVIGLEKSGLRFNARPLVFLGDASYSVYLFHTFAISITYRFLRGVPGLAGPVLATACGVGAGSLVYLLLEKPLTRALRRRKPQVAESAVPHHRTSEPELAGTTA